MAIFKPLRGNRESLSAQPLHDGHAYFCIDDGTFHIDYTDADGNLQRKQLNAKDAETLTGMSLEEMKEYFIVNPEFNTDNLATPLVEGETLNKIYIDTSQNVDEYLATLTYDGVPNETIPFPYAVFFVVNGAFFLAVNLGGVYGIVADRSDFTENPRGVIYASPSMPEAYLSQFGLTHAGWQTDEVTYNNGADFTITSMSYPTPFLSSTSLDTEAVSGFLKRKPDGSIQWDLCREPKAEPKSLAIGDELNTIYFDTSRDIDEELAGLTYIITDNGMGIAPFYEFKSTTTIGGFYIPAGLIENPEPIYALILNGDIFIYVSKNCPIELVAQYGGTHVGWQMDSYTFTSIETLTTIAEEVDFISSTPYAVDYSKQMLLRIIGDGKYEWTPIDKGGEIIEFINPTFDQAIALSNSQVEKLVKEDTIIALTCTTGILEERILLRNCLNGTISLDGSSIGGWNYRGIRTAIGNGDIKVEAVISNQNGLYELTFSQSLFVEGLRLLKDDPTDGSDNDSLLVLVSQPDLSEPAIVISSIPKTDLVVPGGAEGQVYTKTADGVEWRDPVSSSVSDATTTVKGITTLGASGGAARYGYKADVGLSNVDNTADLDKPISTATQEALNGKINIPINDGVSGNVLKKTDDGVEWGGMDLVTYVESLPEANIDSPQFIIYSRNLYFKMNNSSQGLTYSLDSNTNTYTVTGIGTCADTDIIIPSTYQGRSVTSIGDSAFYNCDSFTNIKIPDSITAIGEKAFMNCDGLTSIKIPDSIAVIGEKAFSNCRCLISATIGDGVETISNIFSSCYNLTSVEIGSNVASIEASAFSSCSKLYEVINKSDLELNFASTENGRVAYYAKIIVDKNGNKIYKQEEGIEYIDTADRFLFKKENGIYTLIAYLGGQNTITLPENLNGNIYNINKMCGVVNIIIPNTITTISDSAFYQCSSLTSVVISNSVTSIDDKAFYNCPYLTSVVIGDGVKSIGVSAFRQCSRLTSVIIPDSVVTIDKMAFYYCSGLISVEIGNSVTTIGENAFGSCSNLTSIKIPDSVMSIDDFAFANCNSLTSITVDENNQYYKSVDGSLYTKDDKTLSQYAIGKTDTSFTIPEGVETIGGRAFASCDSLTSVVIPDSVTSIGERAFDSCSSLMNIEIPNNVIIIGEYAFNGCDNLAFNEYENIKYLGNKENLYYALIKLNNSTDSAYIIHPNTKIIGDAAFASCSNLESVVIPNGVITIGNRAFASCSSLTSIEIPNSVTTIGTSAFNSCKNLTNIIIPNNINLISEFTFSNCLGLTSIVIPNSVTSIDRRAFYSCSHLISATFDNPNGWEIGTLSDFLQGSGAAVTLTDTAQNATYLKATYVDNYWKRFDTTATA